MSVNTVNGSKGPYDNYGRNAAYQFQKLVPEKRAETAVQITPNLDNIEWIDDFFGYAQQDLALFDTIQPDGYLDLDELRQAFDDEDAANKFLTAIDINDDQRIDVEENALYTMYQDWTGEQNGIITPDEAATALQTVLMDPEDVNDELTTLQGMLQDNVETYDNTVEEFSEATLQDAQTRAARQDALDSQTTERQPGRPGSETNPFTGYSPSAE